MYPCTQVHTQAPTPTLAPEHTSMCRHRHAHSGIHTQACTNRGLHTGMHTGQKHVHTYVYTCTHTQAHVPTHNTHIHTEGYSFKVISNERNMYCIIILHTEAYKNYHDNKLPQISLTCCEQNDSYDE